MFMKYSPLKIIFLLFFVCPSFVSSQNIPKPVAKPEIIKKRYFDLFNEIKKQNWQIAKSIANDYDDKILFHFVIWLDITRPGSKHSFKYLTNFLKNNSDWPMEELIKKKVEISIDKTVSDEKIYDWFLNNKPLTVKGKIDFFETKIRLGKINNKTQEVKKIWINEDLTYSQQRYFIKKYNKFWDNEDNWKRFDRLLWEGKTVSARRTLKRIYGDLRKLGNARLALSTRSPNVSSMIKKVPGYLKNDPGLVYERMRWRRKAKLDTAADFLFEPPENIMNHRNWWINARIVIRRLINREKYEKAYRLLSNHKIPINTISGSEAEWLAGWVSLTFLNKPQLALDHFGLLYNNFEHPSSKSKAAYWIATAMKKKKDSSIDIQKWHEVSSQYKHSFYSQNSSIKIGNFDFPRIEIKQSKPSCCVHFLKIIDILISNGEEKKIFPFLLKSFQLSKNIEEKNFLMNFAKNLKNKNHLINLSKKDTHRKFNYSYPQINKLIPKKFSSKNEMALINAIILQESAFKIDAYSSAGARGLMQLMPYTAKIVAKSLGIKYYKNALSTNAEYNILLGTTYIKGLLKDFNNSLPLALAGYNAGPGRVKIWIRRYGDPRKNQISYVDWIESIPISETRKYVKKVISNYRIYKKKFKSSKINNLYMF